MRQVRREETRKHRWLIEDRILHLARTDMSPGGFLLLETGKGPRLTGELHVIPWADGDNGEYALPFQAGSRGYAFQELQAECTLQV